MSYTINRFNQSVMTVVEDGTIDQTTDLKLIGKNFASYGEIQNENFLFLLENFSSANQPPKPISGQLWFDSGENKLKFYDGSQFRTTGGSEVKDSEPSGLTEGDFWWDSTNEQLYAFNGSDFVLIGPQDAGQGITQMISFSVTDTQGFAHAIIASVVNDVAIHVISNDEFTLSANKPPELADFGVIKKGLTLTNTPASSGGVTQSEHIYWGTVSNAKKLGGLDASQYVQKGAPVFDSAEFGDPGIAIGNSNDLRIKIENGNQAIVQNEIGEVLIFKINDGSGTVAETVKIDSESMYPGLDSNNNSKNIGKQNQPFKDVFAQTFNGLATKAESLIYNNNKKFGDVEATADTVAIRDSGADLKANLFRGIALQAKYADLAEIYTTDQNYEAGTVLGVSYDEDQDLTAANRKNNIKPVGVVSENPSVLMNSENNGQQVAIEGRVPVKVKGKVRKGQEVVLFGTGEAAPRDFVYSKETDAEEASIVGVALENSTSEDVKLIECILKV